VFAKNHVLKLVKGTENVQSFIKSTHAQSAPLTPDESALMTDHCAVSAKQIPIRTAGAEHPFFAHAILAFTIGRNLRSEGRFDRRV
jgi:hypothetical protein